MTLFSFFFETSSKISKRCVQLDHEFVLEVDGSLCSSTLTRWNQVLYLSFAAPSPMPHRQEALIVSNALKGWHAQPCLRLLLVSEVQGRNAGPLDDLQVSNFIHIEVASLPAYAECSKTKCINQVLQGVPFLVGTDVNKRNARLLGWDYKTGISECLCSPGLSLIERPPTLKCKTNTHTHRDTLKKYEKVFFAQTYGF